MAEQSAKSASAGPVEHRRRVRSRTLVGGTIVFRDGASSLRCIVRNRTENGAQLEIPGNQLIPKRFYLVTAKDNQVREAEMVWRKDNRIGIVLGNLVDLATTTDRALRHLRRLIPAAQTDGPKHDWEDESRGPV